MDNKHIKTIVSIIIPNYNGEKYLRNCLDSLLIQTTSDFEIIVVDDASTDASMEILQNFGGIRLIRNARNSGFARSVNEGIKASHGLFLLLLNNDVVLEPDFIEKILKAIQRNPKIFSVSSRMVRYYERDKLDDTGDFYHILGWAFKRGDGKPVMKYLKPTRVFSTCAGAGLYRKSVFDEIGLFDENYFAYLEDVDVSYRAMIYGYENWYEPTAVCYHIGSATTADGNKYSPFKVRLSARNNVYTAYKNMPAAQLLINSPFLFCGFAIKTAVFTKRGYGKEYVEGLWEGVRTIGKVKKTRFQKKNTLNYLKIEAMLLENLARHIKEKID
jgi:GT2 family glycosyltransferase